MVDHANEAFQAAYSQFINSLPDKERSRYAPCASPKDLLGGLEKLESFSNKRQKSHTRRLLQSIGAFCDRLQPYFDTIGIFAQSNEYACIAWGSLRLILQVSELLSANIMCIPLIWANHDDGKLASNFSSFFEKLIRLIDQLSDVFPQYKEIANLFPDFKSQRIKRHLEDVYGDLLQFFQIVARIFTTSSGGGLAFSIYESIQGTHSYQVSSEVLRSPIIYCGHRSMFALKTSLFGCNIIKRL
jgi:hypothetical protein